MKEFWVSSGHHFTTRAPGGGLRLTDAFLMAYLARPELLPPDDACAAERALHARLMREPQGAVTPQDIAALADPDARENWTFMVDFRDRLLAAPTLEAAYLAMVRNGVGRLPPLFLNQLTHVILRNALDGCEDTYVLRAAELFFRAQRVSVSDGAALLADAETIERHRSERPPIPLVEMLQGPVEDELDVLDDATAFSYWSRSDAFSMVLNLGSNPRSRAALGRAIAAWVKHLLGVEATVEPIERIRDDDWRWFVGLDAEATRIGNALWNGETLDDEAFERVLALFRLDFAPKTPVVPAAAGKPVYLVLAMTADKIVRMKPQNLVTGLPLADRPQA
jgi:hypothetical protein